MTGEESVPNPTAPAIKPCERCGYALTGQPVSREPHYGWLIVQCPECSLVTPVTIALRQRRGCLRAAVSMVFSVAVFAGMVGFLAGLSQSTAYAASFKFAEFLALSFEGDVSIYDRVSSEHWSVRRVDERFDAAGGWTHAVEWIALTDWLYFLVGSVIAAVVCAILWRHTRSRGLAIRGALVSVVSCVVLVLYYLDSNAPYGFEWPMSKAEWKVGVPIAAASMVVGTGCLIAAMYAGRAMARFVCQIFLPPVLRLTIHELWTLDKLPIDP
jgi:hypothetical protein